MNRALLFIIVGLFVAGLIMGFRHQRQHSHGAPPAPLDAAPVPYVPPAVKTRSIIALVDRNRPVAERISGDISARITSVHDPEDLGALAAVLSDAQDDPTVRNEIANLLARSHYDRLGDALLRVLDNPREKTRFRAFAVQHLGEILTAPAAATITYESQPALQTRILTKLRSLLKDPDAPVKREALLALVRQRDPAGAETAVAWLHAPPAAAPDADLRDIAIRCVHELNLREQLERIRVLTRDDNDIVRIAAIVALSEWGDQQSRGEFQRAAASSDARLQRCGTLALQTLDNQTTHSK
jgi:HEAT repeat protein